MRLGNRRKNSSLEEFAAANWLLTSEELIHYGITRPEECKNYLSFEAWSRIVRGALTESGWSHVLDNKWWFDLCYGSHGLPLPMTYGLLHPVSGMTRDHLPLREPAQLLEWILSSQIREFVLKPVYGWASEGVLVVELVIEGADGVSFLMQSGEELSDTELWRRLQMGFRGVPGYLVQQKLGTHPDLLGVGLDLPYSLRVVTAVGAAGHPQILMSVMYLGRTGDMVNKWESGALSIHVDPESGMLGQGKTLPRFGTAWLSSHPDTGAVFEGVEMPKWDEVRTVCLDAARYTPGCRMVTWEVLITDSGAKLIEGNLGFGLTMLQVHTEGLLKEGPFRAALEEAGADLPDGTHDWLKRHAVPPFRRFVSRQKRKLASIPGAQSTVRRLRSATRPR